MDKGIEIIGVQTADRPPELARMLSSLIPHLKTYGRKPKIIISDDSSIENFSTNSANIEKYRKDYVGDIVHLSEKDRKDFADKIASKSGIAKDIVYRALCKGDKKTNYCGAGRNTLLLMAAGKKLLMLDDDVTLITYDNPFKHSGLEFSSSYQDGYSYFDSYEQASNFFPKIEIDYIGLHEKHLGQKVKDVIDDYDKQPSVNKLPTGSSPIMLNKIKTLDDKARIRVTHSGSVGDSWARYHSSLDASDRRPHDLFGQDEEQYIKNTTTPFVSRIDDCDTLYHGPVCVSLNIGLDLTDIVPPFTTMYRGQDNIFGLIMYRTNQNSFSFRYPVGIDHHRGEPRKRNLDPYAHMSTVSLPMKIAINSCFPLKQSDTPELAIISLGEELIDFSMKPTEEVEALIGSYMHKQASGLSQLYAYFKNYYASIAPKWWHDDIVRTMAKRRGSEIFLDAPEWSSDGADGWNSFKIWVKEYGEILKYWPVMFKSAL